MGNQNHAKATVQSLKQGKTFKTFENKILSPRNKDRKFLNSTFFFSFAPTLSPYS